MAGKKRAQRRKLAAQRKQFLQGEVKRLRSLIALTGMAAAEQVRLGGELLRAERELRAMTRFLTGGKTLGLKKGLKSSADLSTSSGDFVRIVRG